VPRWFDTVETVPAEQPYTADLMRELGLRGINVGSSRKLERGWLNTDLVRLQERNGRESELGRLTRANSDLYFLRQDSIDPYPIEDASFEWAYSEHFIEHITWREAIAWLTEVARILRPGGLVRVTTPNMALFAAAYVDRQHPFYDQLRERVSRTRRFPEGPPDRRSWMLNDIFHGWHHRWLYDLEELTHALIEGGFDPGTIVERSYGESAVDEVGALDSEGRAYQTLYVEARTPLETAAR
jgi:predicted SAM-dependent methyltransferase